MSKGVKLKKKREKASLKTRIGRNAWLFGILFIVIAIGVLTTTGSYFGSLNTGGNTSSSTTNPNQVPNFHLTDVDGNTFDTNDFHGKVVVYELMYVGCPACEAQMDALHKIAERYSDQVVILTIDVQLSQTAEQLAAYRNDHNASGIDNWIFAMDTDGVANYFAVTATPTLAFVTKDGLLSTRHVGYMTEDELAIQIEALL